MNILPYDLNDPQQRSDLETEIQRSLVDDLAVHQQYREEWNEANDRLNGNVVPFGFTEDHSEALASQNDARVKKMEVKEYVSVNRSRPNHESVLGDFASMRRRLTITGRQPQMRNIAKVYAERVKYIEDTEMLPEMIYFPSMDNAFAKGLHWIKVTYNPSANQLRGKFDIDEISCREVLVDARSRGAFFSKARRMTHVFQLTKDEARAKFEAYPFFDSENLSEDNEYNELQNRRQEANMWKDLMTFYQYEFIKPVRTYYMGQPGSGEIVEITSDEYQQYRNDPIFGPLVFEGEMEDRYYIALYNTRQGCFHLQENVLKMFSFIPLVNIMSEDRLYPFGDMKFYSGLSDLLDVLVTVFLDNAKKSNTPIIPMDPQAYDDYGVQVKHAAKHGGAAPGATNVFYAQPINEALTMLIPWVLGWIQDTASKHSASMGELPSKQVAKETVQTLIAKDRQSHGRKDVMLKYTLTQLARAIVRLVNVMEDQPDFFAAVDPRPGDFEYIPMNQTWTEDQYSAELAKLAKMPPPTTPEEAQMFMEALPKIRRKFEESNDVRPTTMAGFIVQGLQVTPAQLRVLIENSQLSSEEFNNAWQPMASMITIYKVNTMNQDVDFKVVYGIDDDYENDKQFQANRALMLNERGAMSKLDMLREMRIINPEQIVENADEENQMIQLAKVIGSDPQLMAIVQQLVNNPEAVKRLAGGGGEPSGKPGQPKQVTAGQPAAEPAAA